MTSPSYMKSEAICFELLILFVCFLFHVCVFSIDIICDGVRSNRELGFTLSGGV